MGIDVSIIIVNYNTKEFTLNCINSVFNQTFGLSFEVIVVDNVSTDGSAELFSQDDRILFVSSGQNLGFGMANNVGFKIARGKYVFCLNPDTILLNNAIQILFDFMESNPRVGICGGNLFDADMKPTHSYRMMLPSLIWEIDYKFGELFTRLKWGKNAEFNYWGNPMKVGYITGADMMIRKEIVDKTGGFSKYFFMYYEECELTYRIKNAGYLVYSVPNAHIMHLEGKSFKSSDLTWKEKCMIKSRWSYRKLCYPSSIYKLLRLYTMTLSNLSRKNNPRSLFVNELLRKIENEK